MKDKQHKFLTFLLLGVLASSVLFAQEDESPVAPMTINVPFDSEGQLLYTEGAALTVWGRTIVVDQDHENVDLNNAMESDVNLEDYPDIKEYALWVEHGIVSERLTLVEVENWADYVFDESYDLPSASEIEEKLSKTNQLPGFETLSVKKHVSLKEMNLFLLEKLEELSLLIIDEKNELDLLKNKSQSTFDEDRERRLLEELSTIENELIKLKNNDHHE